MHSTTAHLQEWLARLRQGDARAQETFLLHAQERVRLFIRKMLRRFPRVRRWEDSDDVLQRVLQRLNTLLNTMIPASPADLLRLATTHIRRVLIDLIREINGPQSFAHNHATPAQPDASADQLPTVPEARDDGDDPARLELWTRFHEEIDRLPAEEREAFDLLWYQGLSQEQTADLLQISRTTVQRRWQAARLRLAESLGPLLEF